MIEILQEFDRAPIATLKARLPGTQATSGIPSRLRSITPWRTILAGTGADSYTASSA